MCFLAYITVIPATPSRRLVFRLRTRHIESPSGLRGIVYLLLLAQAHQELDALFLARHSRYAIRCPLGNYILSNIYHLHKFPASNR